MGIKDQNQSGGGHDEWSRVRDLGLEARILVGEDSFWVWEGMYRCSDGWISDHITAKY